MLILYILSLLYGSAVRIRNLLYDRGILKVRKLPVPVISVGNLSVGGSGKTSLTVFLAANLSRKRRVAVVMRGYRRRSRGPKVVCEWGNLLADVWEAGDEAYMVARIVPQISVVVAEDRYEGGRIAVRDLGSDLIILDDGFQHRKLHRDIDILTLRRKDLHDRVLPLGRLREPASSISRADALVLSYQEIDAFEVETDIPVFRMERVFDSVVDSQFKVHPLDVLKEKSVIAFGGLGDNDQFFRTLDTLGLKVKERIGFPDHHHYRDFKLKEGETYLTTLKDLVKLPPHPNLYALNFSLKVPGLIDFVTERLHL